MQSAVLALAAAIYSTQVAAQSLNYYPQSGTNHTAPNEGYATFMEADQSPNASHSVQFAHYDTILGDPMNDTILKNWTWTVKVSDVYMPNASIYNGSLTNVAYTTYDFSWPEQGSLNSALRAEVNASLGEYYPSCAFLITAHFPEHVSKRWDGTSDCSSALGSKCVEALTNRIHASENCVSSFPSGNPDFMTACEDSFGSVNNDGWGIGGTGAAP